MLEWLDTLFPRLFLATIGLSIATVAVRGLVWFFRSAPPGWQRTAWFVVLVQGLMIVRLPVSIPWYEPPPAAPHDDIAIAKDDTSQTPQGTTVQTGAAPASLETDGTVVPVSRSPKPGGLWPWRRWAVLAWLVGCISLPLAWLWTYVRFVRRIPAGQHADEDWLREWRELLVQCGVRRSIPLVVTASAGPALCLLPSGYRVLVPQRAWREFSSKQRLTILRHELAHYKRNDVFKSLAARLMALAHWFNPCAWWVVRRFELCAEWSCDQAATAGDDQSVTMYAKALLWLGEAGAGAAPYRPAAQGSELSSRIQQLLLPKFEKGSPMKIFVFVAVVSLLTVSALLRFSLVARSAQKESGKAGEASAPAVPAPAEDRIATGDLLKIQVLNTLPGHPIEGVYKVEASGKVALGPKYKRVVVVGVTLEEAEEITTEYLRTILEDPVVSVTRAVLKTERLDVVARAPQEESDEAGEAPAPADPAPAEDRIAAGDLLKIQVLGTLPDQPIDGVYKVEASGNVKLGPTYKRVVVVGATLEEAEGITTEYLRTNLRDPVVSVTRAVLKTERLDE
ncbi:MAG TPA: M56 family metallopeptidase [Pirellulales bacterium]|nr:M56 family metallopeptidase [Pirellulales bacterium]